MKQMIPILEELFKEIEHGDKEHREWLYGKMLEFSNKFTSNMSEARTLTFGQKAVGITFNPSNLPGVDQIKQECAKIIDTLDQLRNEAVDGEMKAQFTLAIRKIQEGQMWGVKAITLN